LNRSCALPTHCCSLPCASSVIPAMPSVVGGRGFSYFSLFHWACLCVSCILPLDSETNPPFRGVVCDFGGGRSRPPPRLPPSGELYPQRAGGSRLLGVGECSGCLEVGCGLEGAFVLRILCPR